MFCWRDCFYYLKDQFQAKCSFHKTRTTLKARMKLTSYIRNDTPFATAKFCRSFIWTFSVTAWQPQNSFNTSLYFFLWYDPYLSQNLIFLSVLTFTFWFSTSKTWFTQFSDLKAFQVSNYRHQNTLLCALLGAGQPLE